jgi:hypothetical protein
VGSIPASRTMLHEEWLRKQFLGHFSFLPAVSITSSLASAPLSFQPQTVELQLPRAHVKRALHRICATPDVGPIPQIPVNSVNDFRTSSAVMSHSL